MSKEFIQKRHGSNEIAKAKTQQKDILHLVKSQVQEEITQSYIDAWAERNYIGNDAFLNWIKTIFRTDNFLTFFKYCRNPLPSAKLVNNDLLPSLARVFSAEDSFFNYTIRGEKVEEVAQLDSAKFSKDIFDYLLFNYNDFIVTDLQEVNTPVRFLLSIDSVVSIDATKDTINAISYTASINVDGRTIEGYAYVDGFTYEFYDKDYRIVNSSPHDLGHCPVQYISQKPFSDHTVLRESLFSYIREELEEYDFLKTLLKMSIPNGVVPIVSMVKDRVKKDNKDKKGETDKEPSIANIIGSQQSEMQKQTAGEYNVTQAGNIIKVPMLLDSNMKVDMDLVKNWINFHHAPVEPMEFLKERIEELRISITQSIIGSLTEHNQDAKNELQVKSGVLTAEDKLQQLSMEMTKVRLKSDYNFLALQYGANNVTVEGSYGTEFFWQSTEQLYTMFNNSPNVVERRNILVKIAKNRNKFNPDRKTREVILYGLLPYISDKDFDSAVTSKMVDPLTFQYQTRFEYWINMFEAEYGDIVQFWNAIDGSDSERQITINGLILDIIKNNTVEVSQNQNEE